MINDVTGFKAILIIEASLTSFTPLLSRNLFPNTDIIYTFKDIKHKYASLKKTASAI